MTPLRCERLVRCLSDYIDGTIDDSICRHFQAHLEDCEPCRVFIRNFKKSVAIFKRQGSVRPPARLKESLRRQLRACRDAINSSRSSIPSERRKAR